MSKRVPAGGKEYGGLCGRWLWSGIAEPYVYVRAELWISDDRVACYSEKYEIYLIRSALQETDKEKWYRGISRLLYNIEGGVFN